MVAILLYVCPGSQAIEFLFSTGKLVQAYEARTASDSAPCILTWVFYYFVLLLRTPVSAQAPRGFVIFERQIPLIRLELGRVSSLASVVRTHRQDGRQNPSKRVSIFDTETSPRFKSA